MYYLSPTESSLETDEYKPTKRTTEAMVQEIGTMLDNACLSLIHIFHGFFLNFFVKRSSGDTSANASYHHEDERCNFKVRNTFCYNG